MGPFCLGAQFAPEATLANGKSRDLSSILQAAHNCASYAVSYSPEAQTGVYTLRLSNPASKLTEMVVSCRPDPGGGLKTQGEIQLSLSWKNCPIHSLSLAPARRGTVPVFFYFLYSAGSAVLCHIRRLTVQFPSEGLPGRSAWSFVDTTYDNHRPIP